jgi:hypothetical protein
MTARFGSLGTQYFTDDNVVAGGGSVTFYEPGTTTLKDTYSDSALTILNTNPVLLDAAGRLPNVFFAGLAKAVLKDSEGEIIETRDPVGDFDSGTEAFTTWAADVEYPVNAVVAGSDGYFYVSQVNPNIANDPTTSPTEWKLLVEQLGFDGTVNGNVYVVDTSDDQGIGNVTKNVVRALVPISTVVASNAATVDFTGLDNSFDYYIVEIVQARSDADSRNFIMRTSANNGVSYDSGASDYAWSILRNQNGTVTGAVSATTSQIQLSGNDAVGNAAGELGVTATVRVIKPSDATATEVIADYAYMNNSGFYTNGTVYGRRVAAAAVNAIRFFFASDNIATGTFTLYGVRRS